MKEYIEREAAVKRFTFATLDCLGMEPQIRASDAVKAIKAIPVADVPPALWTDAPIVGTEFMTHSQGQGGFEIHFRTDSREKYEAVQEECRRQIDHTKPAADVVAVRPSHWVYDGYGEFHCHACKTIWHITEGTIDDWAFCPNCGAKMDGGVNDGKAD